MTDRGTIEGIVSTAVYFAEQYHSLDTAWLVDLLIENFKDALRHDARFPKLSQLDFDLLVADAQRRAELTAEEWLEERVGDFTQTIIDDIVDNLTRGGSPR